MLPIKGLLQWLLNIPYCMLCKCMCACMRVCKLLTAAQCWQSPFWILSLWTLYSEIWNIWLEPNKDSCDLVQWGKWLLCFSCFHSSFGAHNLSLETVYLLALIYCSSVTVQLSWAFIYCWCAFARGRGSIPVSVWSHDSQETWYGISATKYGCIASSSQKWMHGVCLPKLIRQVIMLLVIWSNLEFIVVCLSWSTRRLIQENEREGLASTSRGCAHWSMAISRILRVWMHTRMRENNTIFKVCSSRRNVSLTPVTLAVNRPDDSPTSFSHSCIGYSVLFSFIEHA